MKKIAVIGSPGAGKSTFSRELGERIDIPVHHLDKYFWNPDWEETPRDEWIDTQKKLVSKERWIIDGNYGTTLYIRLREADTVFFFDFNRFSCLFGILKRRIIYHNRSREDMSEGCPERLDLEFLRWIWNFPDDERKRVVQRLEELDEEKEVMIFKGRKDVIRFLSEL